MPGDPGVQISGLLSEFQLPAQASPFSAMVRTVGSVDWKEKDSPAGPAVKAWVVPTWSETLELGLMETEAGTTGGAMWVAPPPPHDGRRAHAIIRNDKAMAEENFPMNPSTEE
jgi:hypothetical protein